MIGSIADQEFKTPHEDQFIVTLLIQVQVSSAGYIGSPDSGTD